MCGRYFINGDSAAEVERIVMNGGYGSRRRAGAAWLSEQAPVTVRQVKGRLSEHVPGTARQVNEQLSEQAPGVARQVNGWLSEQAPVAVRQVNGRRSGSACRADEWLPEQVPGSACQADVRPSELATVLSPGENGFLAADMRWGFISPRGKGLLINARAETALQKPSFSDSLLRRRCIIPAAGFYEWDRERRQYSFFLPEAPVLYMAGCFRRYEDGDHFTILTTAANESMDQIHDRMPLILPDKDLEDWIFEAGRTAEFLRRGSPILGRKLTHPAEDVYEQLTLPGIF